MGYIKEQAAVEERRVFNRGVNIVFVYIRTAIRTIWRNNLTRILLQKINGWVKVYSDKRLKNK